MVNVENDLNNKINDLKSKLNTKNNLLNNYKNEINSLKNGMLKLKTNMNKQILNEIDIIKNKLKDGFKKSNDHLKDYFHQHVAKLITSELDTISKDTVYSNKIFTMSNELMAMKFVQNELSNNLHIMTEKQEQLQ